MPPTPRPQAIHLSSRRKAVTGRLLVALLVAVLALLAAVPSVGQAHVPAGVTDGAVVASVGRVRGGRWTPVSVEVENRGASTIEGELRVGESGSFAASTRYVEDVVLPAGGRKRFTIYAMAPSTSQEVEALLVQRGRTIASTTAKVTMVDEEDLLAGVIGTRAGVYNLLTTLSLPGGSRETFVVAVAPDALPDRPEALNAFDVLILGGPLDAPLSAARAAALEAWVADGGTLVLPAGNRDVDLTSLPPGLLPAKPAGIREMGSTAALERLGGEALPENAQARVAESVHLSGRVLAEQDGVPLAVLGRHGMGHVLYLAFDPSAQPFAGWNGMKKAWEELLFQALPASTVSPSALTFTGGRGPRAYVPSQWVQSLYNAVAFLPSLEMPSANLLLGLIGGYILLVGPVNYLVLRKLRRASLAWVTVPVLVLVFSSGTYFLASGSKGSDVQVNEVNVLRWAGDTEWAHAYRFAGVFVPSEGDYRVGMAGGGLLAPMTPGDVRYRGGPRPSSGAAGTSMYMRTTETGSYAEVRDAGKWTMQTLSAESVERAPRRLAADLYVEGDRLKGAVSNNTGMDLEALWLGTGAGAVNLGALANGAKAPVDVALTDSAANLTGNLVNQIQSTNPRIRSSGFANDLEMRHWERQSQAVSGAIEASYEQPLDGARALLVGWSNAVAVGVTVDGKSPAGEALTILVQPVLPKLRGAVSIPGGMVSARVQSIQADQVGGTGTPFRIVFASDRGRSITGFNAGSVTYELELPSGLELERMAVQVPFNGIAPIQGVAVQAYRWDAGVWETLTTTTVSLQSGPSGPGGAQAVYGARPPSVLVAPPPASAPIPVYRGPGGGQVTVLVTDGPSVEWVFPQALEGEAGNEPSRYVSAGGLVRVRLVVQAGAAASQPVTLGTPTLALAGVAHGS